jgi:hypothetical protein
VASIFVITNQKNRRTTMTYAETDEGKSERRDAMIEKLRVPEGWRFIEWVEEPNRARLEVAVSTGLYEVVTNIRRVKGTGSYEPFIEDFVNSPDESTDNEIEGDFYKNNGMFEMLDEERHIRLGYRDYERE